MSLDEQVGSRHILAAVVRLKRQGAARVLQELEPLERELAGYVMEELSMLHGKLLDLGASAKQTQRLLRRIEALVLVCVTALWQSHYELWRRQTADGPLAELQSSLEASDDESAGGPPGAAPGR